MSIAEMTATLRKEVLKRLQEQYLNTVKSTASERNFKTFKEYTSTEKIRSDTDSGKNRHESLMSRGGFKKLAEDIGNAFKKHESLSFITKEVLSSASYDNFVEHLLTEVKHKSSSSKDRIADGFNYSGASRRHEGAGITVVTELRDNSAGPSLPSDKDVVILRNIAIGTIVDKYADYLTKLVNNPPAGLNKEIRGLLNAGHLTGAFNARFIRALNLRKDGPRHAVFDSSIKNTTPDTKRAEAELNRIMQLLTDADYLSSNLLYDVNLFIVTDKRLYANKAELKLTTEAQLGDANKKIGNLLAQAGKSVSALIETVNPKASTDAARLTATDVALQSLYANLKGLSAEVRRKAEELKSQEIKLSKDIKDNLDNIFSNLEVMEKITSSPGSRSIPDHIGYVIARTIQGLSTKSETSKATVKGKLTTSTKPIKKVSPILKIKKATKVTSKSLPPIRNKSGQFYSLANLQAVLDAQLQHVVSANMGDGSARKILNFRTGRLAASAKVERLSLSKDGMITAFYSYMRNPYGTFSEGGKQQYPKTRDPKLLISTSIRQIAAEKVNNRLRAVLL